jgi:hypothetical protein
MSEENTHAPAMGKRTVPKLVFGGDLATGIFAINSPPEGTDGNVNSYNEWNLNAPLL